MNHVAPPEASLDDHNRQLGATPESIASFWSWFEGSHARDQVGRPKMLFHGTPNGGFRSFSEAYRGVRTKHAADDVGYHFTDNPGYAESYSEGYHIESIEAYRKMFGEEPKGIKMPPAACTYPVYLRMLNPLHVAQSKMIDAALIEGAKKAGHDSIIADMGGSNEYVVFDAKQIKSATGNSGLFLRDSADLVDGPPDRIALTEIEKVTRAKQLITASVGEVSENRSAVRRRYCGPG
jgi:hypothetical protein